MPRRITLKHTLIAALAASVLGATPALAEPIDPSNHRFDGSGAWSPGQELPAYPQPAYPVPDPAKKYTIEDGRSADTRDAAKDAAIQPGQPTWPLNPKVLTPPRTEGSTRGGATDNDDIWLVLGIGLAGAALAGGAAGAARYTRVRARRVAV